MSSLSLEFTKKIERIRQGQSVISQLSSETKNKILNSLAEKILSSESEILAANKVDLQSLPAETTSAFRDRLTLNSQRLAGMAESLRQVAQLGDPVNEIVEERHLPNGLKIKRVRSPLGLIFMIFESRPNVILEAFSLAFKAGNSIILRGGSDSAKTSEVIYQIVGQVLANNGLKDLAMLGVQDYNRDIVHELLKKKEWIDIVVPRGGDKLIAMVEEHSLMPIIKNDRGLCHAFIDREADLKMACELVINGKTQRPGVCNSLETVLIDESIAKTALPLLAEALLKKQVQLRCDSQAYALLQGDTQIVRASEEDWNTEYLDLILNVKIVKNFDAALEHIARYGSRHSELIITENPKTAERFQRAVDAAAVYWNASTRFTDGFELGLGGELGISTQKLHVRGPIGLKELTTPRWLVTGQGQVRS